ncbi:hypothetical protein ACJ9E6_000326 [Providencia rettgeri]
MIFETSLIRAALMLTADANDSREYLHCIHINEKYIEATDGKAFVRMEHGQPIDADILVKFTQKIPANAEFSQIVLNEKPFVIHYDGTETAFASACIELIDSKYPQLDHNIPRVVIEKMPLISSRMLALPYLLFNSGAVGLQPSSETGAIRFIFDAFTNHEFGNPMLVAMPTHPDSFTAAQKSLDEYLSGATNEN